MRSPGIYSLLSLLSLLAAAASPAAGQTSELAAPCPALPAEAQRRCFAVAQAAESAQAPLGMLIASGNPILGVAGTGGLRIGTLPRIDISPRLNLVFVRIPDILTDDLGTSVQRVNRAIGIPAPALATTVAVGVVPGFDVAPGVGGLGSLDLLVGASWLPFGLVDTDGFSRSSPFAWSIGGRVGLLRESFTVPAVSVSILYRALGQTSFGHVCRADRIPGDVCLGPGDVGEFSFDLTDWSTRLAVGKRVLGLGAAAGVGYDRFASDVSYAFRYPLEAGTAQIVEVGPTDVRSDRWSVFGNLGYSFLVTSVVLEAGWLQGASPIPGYDVQGFDPRHGVWFGSLGARIGF